LKTGNRRWLSLNACSGARAFSFAGVFGNPELTLHISGLGDKGWEITAEIRAEFGLKIVTEAVDESNVALIEKHGDMIQIGARNMQNFRF